MVKFSKNVLCKILQAAIIFFVLLAISFKADSKGTVWIWNGLPFIAIILVLLSFYLAYLWIKLSEKSEVKIPGLIEISGEQKENAGFNGLTEREKEILQLISEGKSNKEIASELNIALSTVKTHINNIYKSLMINSRKDLIKFKTNRNL